MLTWLGRKKNPGTARRTDNRVRLVLEALESRFCPSGGGGDSGASISSFSASVVTGHTVLLSGTAGGSGTITIQFSGVASGSTTAASNGSFSLQTQAGSLGTVYATPSDASGSGSQVHTQLTVAAPTITLGLTQNQGTSVTLSGTVSANTPNGLTVTFSGKATGSTTTGTGGSYSYTANASGTGTISASVVDVWGQQSNVAQVTISASAPTLTLSVTQDANRDVTVTGQVNDESPSGLAVSLSGVVGGSATTSASGAFTFTGLASALGQITAAVTDPWNLSGSGSVQLTNAAPSITGFAATAGSNNMWTFSGQVSDEYAPGLTVTLSNIPGVGNVTVLVSSSDTFSYTVQLAAGASGTVDATVTDWWGAISQMVTVTI